MNAAQNLTMKAASLARIAPEQWRDFLAALADFRDHHRENLVQSPLNELPINQGRAQILGALHKNLSECLVNSEKMTKKEP